MDFKSIIHIIIVWQSLFLGIVFLTPRYAKYKRNFYLSLLLLTLCAHFIYNILLGLNIWVEVLVPFSCCYGFLYGPLSFFYVRSHLVKDAHKKTIYWLHYLPFGIVVVGGLLGVISCNPQLSLLLLLTMFGYSIANLWEIYKYQQTIKNITTQMVIPELKWLKILTLLMLVIIVLNVFSTTNPILVVGGKIIALETVVQIGIFALVNLIAFQGLKNPHFFRQITQDEKNLTTEIFNSKKDSKSSNEIDHEKLEALEIYMNAEKPYLEPDLTIQSLAGKLQIHPKTLSQIINQHFQVNFSEYINTARLEEVKKLLANNSDPGMTVMEIMYDCGFNSRSVFNGYFKKKTGMTPSQYISNLKE